MAEPTANDWKAIHNRMQQIRAEQSAFSRPCPECNGPGWIPDFSGRRHPQTIGYAILRTLPEPKGSAPTPARRQQMIKI
jgi:hypothetical protein